jgi:transcriptional regulator with XRE-family HTH domain/tetratricopeptide (TPR) repeat protein
VIDTKTLSQRLLYEREVRGWSQQYVSDKLGSTRLTVSRWEHGKTLPQSYFLQQLCELFKWRLEEFSLPLPDPLSSASRQPIADPGTPPGPIIPLVGREKLLDEIKRGLLASTPDPFVALHGLPGVGKTALASTLLHDSEVRARFRDGILWVGLGPRPDLPRSLSRWGALLGLSFPQNEEEEDLEVWTELLRQALMHRALLVVIDDAWGLEDALTFKLGGEQCRYLVITRFPGLATQISASSVTAIPPLSQNEGMELLRRLSPQAVKCEPGRAADLVRAVGGLPLALVLIGNALRKQAFSGQARHITATLERLSQAQERLRESAPSALSESSANQPKGSPLSLQSAIAVSTEHLGKEERLALWALSILPTRPDSFSEEAALAVANCSVKTLDALLESGLVESCGASRYMLHQVMADYARLHLEALSHPVGQAARRRLIAYTLPFVETHWQDVLTLHRESQTIIAALEASHELGQQAALVQGTLAFVPFLLVRGLYQLAEQYLQRVFEVASLRGRDRRSALLYAGEAAFKQGRYHEAEKRFQEGLALAREIGDHEHWCVFLLNLATTVACLHQGPSPQASAYLQEGVKLAEMLEPGWIKTLLTFLGDTWGSSGHKSGETSAGKARSRVHAAAESPCRALPAQPGPLSKARATRLRAMRLMVPLSPRRRNREAQRSVAPAAIFRRDPASRFPLLSRGPQQLARRCSHSKALARADSSRDW